MSTNDAQAGYAYPTIVPSLYYTQPKAASPGSNAPSASRRA